MLEGLKQRPGCQIKEISQELSIFGKGYPAISQAALTSKKLAKSIHIAIFIQPYLQYILEGQKTIESRFSINRCAPYKMVDKGDIILLKKSGGPIFGVCRVDKVWFYKLTSNLLRLIKTEFGDAMCINDSKFWESKKKSKYATLIQINNVQIVDPVYIQKRDRRGWVTIPLSKSQIT